jgi:RloB-like protein
MSRHRKIPKRPRFYLGCEGQSEVSYIAWIQDLCEAEDIRIAVERDDLSSGDPLSRVNEAIRRIKQKQAGREPFKACFILLDRDQADADPHKADVAIRLAENKGIGLVWQRPCHEGFLLRHFAGHENDLPANCALADQTLKNVWPIYDKPMDKRDLSSGLSKQEVVRAANNDPAFANLLSAFGLPLA